MSSSRFLVATTTAFLSCFISAYAHAASFAPPAGKTLILVGQDKKTIDAEIERLRPIVEGGGFIPHVDHRCPPDVSYDNYLYYLKRKKEVFNIMNTK